MAPAGSAAQRFAVVSAWGPELVRALEREAARTSPIAAAPFPHGLAPLEGEPPPRPVLIDANQIAFLRLFGKMRRERGPGRFIFIRTANGAIASKYKTYAELKYLSAAFVGEGQTEERFFSRLIELQIDPDGLWVVSVHPQVDAFETVELIKTLRQGPGALTHVVLESGASLFTGSVSGLVAAWMSVADASIAVRPFGEDALGSWWSCLSVEQRGSLPLPALFTRTEVITKLCEGRPLGSSSDVACELQTARAEYVAQTLLLEEAAEERAKAGRQEHQIRRREKLRIKMSEVREQSRFALVARSFVDGVVADGLENVRAILLHVADTTCLVPLPPPPPQPSQQQATQRPPPLVPLLAAASSSAVPLSSPASSRTGGARGSSKSPVLAPTPPPPAGKSRARANTGSDATIFSDTGAVASGSRAASRPRANTAESVTSTESTTSRASSTNKKPAPSSPMHLPMPTPAQPPPPPPPPPSPISSLRKDIEEMAASLELVARRREPWQLAVAERVKTMVYSIWPGAWCDVFGSIASGLAAPCSDVDMVVRGVLDVDRVKVLASHLARQEWVQGLQAIERTLVPVVKFSTAAIPIAFGNRGNVINVDITFENMAHHGLNTCQLVRQLIARWPCLKPLALVLKQFLVEKGLNDPYVGGLSSYALVIMTTAVIKRKYPSGYPYPGAADLGELFVSFLEVYSSPLFLRNGVRLDDHFAEQRFSRNLHDPVFIMDPLDPLNNVGRTCYGITQVVSAFSEALHAVRSIDRVDESSSVLGRVFSTGHHRDVVDLVTKVWCPPELPSSASRGSSTTAYLPPQHPQAKRSYAKDQPAFVSAIPYVSPLPNQGVVEAWARGARAVLEATARDADAGMVVCPCCRQVRGHAVDCALLVLLRSFPALR